LTNLNLDSNNIGLNGTKALAIALPGCNALTKLNISGLGTAEEKQILTDAVAKCPALLHFNFGVCCFTGSSRVAVPASSSSTGELWRQIGQMKMGDIVLGWDSPRDCADGQPPKPVRIARVERVPLNNRRLYGVNFETSEVDAASHQCRVPFFTDEHPLLGYGEANGVTWLAMDERAGRAEITEPSTLHAPIEKLQPGCSLFVHRFAPEAAAILRPVQAVPCDSSGDNCDEYVFNLELDTGKDNEDAAYIVNGLIVMD